MRRPGVFLGGHPLRPRSSIPYDGAMTRTRAAWTCTFAALVALGAAGCSDSSTPAPEATTPAAAPSEAAPGVEAPDCLPEGSTASLVGEGPEGTLVALVGAPPAEAELGVVLAPQSGGDWCQWAAQAERLTAAGYVVGTFTWGSDGSASVEAAVEQVRAAGVERVALVGASKGGAFSVATAADVDAATVIALSPPAEFDGVSARAQDVTYTGPLLVVGVTDDSSVNVAESREVARDDDTWLEVPGTTHGVGVFDTEEGATVWQAIDERLAAAAKG